MEFFNFANGEVYVEIAQEKRDNCLRFAMIDDHPRLPQLYLVFLGRVALDFLSFFCRRVINKRG